MCYKWGQVSGTCDDILDPLTTSIFLTHISHSLKYRRLVHYRPAISSVGFTATVARTRTHQERNYQTFNKTSCRRYYEIPVRIIPPKHHYHYRVNFKSYQSQDTDGSSLNWTKINHNLQSETSLNRSRSLRALTSRIYCLHVTAAYLAALSADYAQAELHATFNIVECARKLTTSHLLFLVN